MKHTPGPWVIEGDFIESLDGDSQIAEMCEWGPDPNELPEQEANARLIAAAPELLEACHEVKNFLANLENGTRRDDPLYGLRLIFHRPVHAVLDSAIAKAEGVDPANGTALASKTKPEVNAK